MAEYDLRAEVLARTSIIDLVNASTPVMKSRDSFRGNCIYHSDQSRSLFVVRQPAIYHCFACGTGGDAIKWVMRRDSVDEEAAIALLASAAGIRATLHQ